MRRIDINKISAGDCIIFKRSAMVDYGCKAIFLRIVADGKDGPDAPTIEYQFAGQTKQASHSLFTLAKGRYPRPEPQGSGLQKRQTSA